MARLNSQLSLPQREFLSQISEESNKRVGDHDTAISSNNTNNSNNNSQIKTSSHSFGTGSWYDNNQTTFSVVASNKRAEAVGLEAMDPDQYQFQFSMSRVSIDMMPTMEKLLHVPEDSVPCKTRAKRGFATHPRSIAERERRTRISGKLKKLQDLVPNMDKQTSYADMLDLAVQHIKSLKNQVEKLRKDLDSCTCGCKMMKDS